ncbi:flagellar hook-length control protein FliK [Massilia sp. P8910]|uniref:flagellar hook-length control protein FliK n=1 Tax=Massilia antarctica TaxID=2765360 RepID=UPI001E4CC622|nr:flagellar hook-length control protein FliK [Massilia antarctica]MCE3606118.1 flagellar hook-length control protein FliK [Massilia antarctica]
MSTISSLPLGAPLIAPLAPVSLLPAPATARVAGMGVPLPASEPLPASGAGAGLPGNLNESAAMRTDQVFMARQLAWPVLDGASLANAWRTMVRAYGAQLAALQEQGRSQFMPGNLLMSGVQHALQVTPTGQQTMMWHPEAWRFVLPGAGGQQLALRLLTGLPDPPPSRRKRAKAALRLDVVLADGSHATVQLELVDGVLMELAAEHPRAVAQLRQALPGLKIAVEQAGLRLARVSVRQGLWPGKPLEQYSAQVSAVLPPSLFRAMAEVALLLAGSSRPDAATTVRFTQRPLPGDMAYGEP